jgi:uncharacterized Zn finger protein (UPF0148 family)
MSDETQTQAEPKQSPDAIREDIERTRAQLAETVDALNERLNVKHQAHLKADAAKAAAAEKLEVAKHTASDSVAAAKQYQKQIVSVAAGVAAIASLLLVLRRARNRR